MEVSKVSEKGVRIKGKLAIIGVNPYGGKGPVDIALLFDKMSSDKATIEGEPLIIQGPGEYEVKGVKLSGFGKDETFFYSARVDGMKVCISKTSLLLKAKDLLEENEIVIVQADAEIDSKIIAILNPSVVIFYGEYADSSAKSLGKEIISTLKYTITKDKLPSEMEVITLG